MEWQVLDRRKIDSTPRNSIISRRTFSIAMGMSGPAVEEVAKVGEDGMMIETKV